MLRRIGCNVTTMLGVLLMGTWTFGQVRPLPPTAPQTGAVEQLSPVLHAMEMNIGQIELARLGASKAEDRHVKEFAEMLVTDHLDILSRLSGLRGAPKAADVESSTKHQQTVERLSTLAGAEFDREFINATVIDHQEALKFFQEQSGVAAGSDSVVETALKTAQLPEVLPQAGAPSATGNETLAMLAREVLPVIRHHLQLAQKIQSDLKGGVALSR